MSDYEIYENLIRIDDSMLNEAMEELDRVLTPKTNNAYRRKCLADLEADLFGEDSQEQE